MNFQYISMNSSKNESLNSINSHIMQNLHRGTLKVIIFLKVMSFYYNLNNNNIILLLALTASS